MRALPSAFTLTARAENYLHGRPDLGDTITRLQAYQEAGADVLYAPGLAGKEEIAAVVRSLDRPVNVVMGLRGVQLSLAALSALGVRRDRVALQYRDRPRHDGPRDERRCHVQSAPRWRCRGSRNLGIRRMR